MNIHTGKYGEGTKSYDLKKMGLEPVKKLSSKEHNELASLRKRDMAKRISTNSQPGVPSVPKMPAPKGN